MAVSLAVREYVASNKLTEPSAVDSSIRLAVWFASYAAVMALAFALASPLTWVLAWTWGGMLFAGCLAALHEAAHDSLYKTKWLNTVAAYAVAIPGLMPCSIWQAWHLAHHTKTHAPGDPEPLARLTATWQYFVGLPAIFAQILATQWAGMFGVLLGRPPAWATRVKLWRALVDLAGLAAMILVLAEVAAADTWWLVAGWLVPWLLGQFLFAPLYQASEHYECDYGPASAFETSRTTISNPLVRFVVWNGNYHTAHHLLASVPGRNLPRLHARIEPECRYLERSYLRWHVALVGRLRRHDYAEPLPERFHPSAR